MPRLTSWETVLYQDGGESGAVVGIVTTLLVQPRWLRFRPAHVLLTVTGVADVEAWVRGVSTAAEAQAFHNTTVAYYRALAKARDPRSSPRVTAPSPVRASDHPLAPSP
jgi:hypothetical protein